MTRKSQAASPKIDNLARAKAQGQAQFNSIKEMVERLETAEKLAIDGPDETEAPRTDIENNALSVQVRSGWYSPYADANDIMRKPCEYEILLCTGGPAVRIVGNLSDHGEPETARLEVQDWFQPWTEMSPVVSEEYDARVGLPQPTYDSEPVLLAYARVFYFGEG